MDRKSCAVALSTDEGKAPSTDSCDGHPAADGYFRTEQITDPLRLSRFQQIFRSPQCRTPVMAEQYRTPVTWVARVRLCTTYRARALFFFDLHRSRPYFASAEEETVSACLFYQGNRKDCLKEVCILMVRCHDLCTVA